MKYTMNHISTGEDEVIVNYLVMTPEIERIVNFIKGEQTRLIGWQEKQQKVDKRYRHLPKVYRNNV